MTQVNQDNSKVFPTITLTNSKVSQWISQSRILSDKHHKIPTKLKILFRLTKKPNLKQDLSHSLTTVHKVFSFRPK